MSYANINTLYQAFLECNQQICTDTRKIISGSIFFALKGDNFNANEFTQQALDAGCAYVVIDEEKYAVDGKTFLVENVLNTMQQLASLHRSNFKHPVIAITGSNGKTTTKELVHAVLSQKFNTLATIGNLNNHIGVPLTLLRLKPEHEMAIIEMGANHQGEIKMLCEIADPDYGIITNIGKAHLEGFGGIEGVKKGKGEMYDFLRKKDGMIFTNGDDAVLHDLADGIDKTTYGTTKLYDIVGKQNVKAEQVEFAWRTRYTATELKNAPLLKTHLVGSYNYNNFLCAVAVGHYFNIEEDKINEALVNYVPSNNRSQLEKTERNTLILDYYNANPSSMKVAIENFAKVTHENKFLILGDMLELGDESVAEHTGIVDLLKANNLNQYILVGPIFKSLFPENSFDDSTKALEHLKTINLSNNLVLVKGSRGIKLENVLPSL